MQDFLAILIVALATAFLARRIWRRLLRRPDGACGSCSNCGSTGSPKTTSLVTITPLKSRH